MNKSGNIWIIALLAVVVIGGVVFFAVRNQQPSSQTSQTQPAGGQQEEKGFQANSRYLEYSKAALEAAADKRRVLYFYANWCPTCRPADADFKTNATRIPEDMVVIRVNYNDTDTDAEEKELARKYGITYQHTFVQIDGKGAEVTKWNGGQVDELLTNIR